jgi:intraflagellar transport protein 46
LDLIYRSKDLQSNRVHVKSIEQAHKNPKMIQAWIDDLSKLHKKNPPQNIKYSKAMPDIETLMKVWQEDYEDLLQTIELPSAELDLDLEQYIKIVCALLDIPVYENLTESLHVLFTLYSEFKSNQHFNQEM